ncbi:DUF4386 domain-containing protein [Cellulomonas sp. ICMP 17802]|uniref:DUF4386 domain-containing protein n=1 Tax=Cellulomonas sp. ICMP 17802 TaxID=3239199 RepID=UPI00351B71DD
MRTARLAGLLYLVVAVLGGFAELFARATVRGADDVAAALREHAGLMKVAFAADLVAFTCFALVGIALYALFREVDRTAAVAMLTLNAISVAIQCLNMVNQAGALLAAQRGSDELAVLFLDLHGVGYLIAQIFFGAWLVPLGYLVVRSGWVPRGFGYALVVGGLGYLAGFAVELVAPAADAASTALGMVGGLSEIAFLLWLLATGAPRLDRSVVLVP